MSDRSLDSDLDVLTLSLLPKHGKVVDHCHVLCAKCKSMSRVSCVNGRDDVSDACDICGAYGEVCVWNEF
jgi:hypothetical protein